MDNGKMDVTTAYSFAPPCSATLLVDEVRGASARHLMERVAKSPQRDPLRQRAAMMLDGALRSGRTLDVEKYFSKAPNDDALGEPVELDEVVINEGDELPDRQALHLRAGEYYVGGT